MARVAVARCTLRACLVPPSIVPGVPNSRRQHRQEAPPCAPAGGSDFDLDLPAETGVSDRPQQSSSVRLFCVLPG
jgi:hypothetical protein